MNNIIMTWWINSQEFCWLNQGIPGCGWTMSRENQCPFIFSPESESNRNMRGNTEMRCEDFACAKFYPMRVLNQFIPTGFCSWLSVDILVVCQPCVPLSFGLEWGSPLELSSSCWFGPSSSAPLQLPSCLARLPCRYWRVRGKGIINQIRMIRNEILCASSSKPGGEITANPTYLVCAIANLTCEPGRKSWDLGVINSINPRANHW